MTPTKKMPKVSNVYSKLPEYIMYDPERAAEQCKLFLYKPTIPLGLIK
jgi:hypothetical protein